MKNNKKSKTIFDTNTFMVGMLICSLFICVGDSLHVFKMELAGLIIWGAMSLLSIAVQKSKNTLRLNGLGSLKS